MNQAEVIAGMETIFDIQYLEPDVLTPATGSKVEAARNIGEFAGLIRNRMQEP